jgi:hypothetical protein
MEQSEAEIEEALVRMGAVFIRPASLVAKHLVRADRMLH